MAEETVDKCIKVCKLKAGKSATKGLLLDGAHDWTPTMFIRLIQDFGLDHKVAFHYIVLTVLIAIITTLSWMLWLLTTVGRRFDAVKLTMTWSNVYPVILILGDVDRFIVC